MGTRVSFTPLYGSASRPRLASLLTIRGFTFLLDCGWDDSYNAALLAPLEAALPRIDAVLLSHADMAHMGALPYLVGRGLQVDSPSERSDRTAMLSGSTGLHLPYALQ